MPCLKKLYTFLGMISVKANLLSAQEELSDQNAWSAGFSGGAVLMPCSRCKSITGEDALLRTPCRAFISGMR